MNRQTKKDYLITLIKQSELPTSKLNTLRMQWESIDLDKVAEFLLDNGVDIVNPYSKLFESCLEPIENRILEMYGIDTRDDIIYFELNNWSTGKDYPDSEPFLSWIEDNKFRDENWIKENKLVVVESIVDMSLNYCVAATKEWVQSKCPELLTKYTQFIRYEEDDDLPEGRFRCPFLEYDEDNIGWHYAIEEEDGNGHLSYIIKE